MISRLLLTTLLAAGLAAGAHAAEPESHARVDADFAAQRAQILEEMHEGGRYAEITPEHKDEVLAALDQMAALLEGSSVDELRQTDRVALFNAQEVVNNRLTQAQENSRVVCKRMPKVGTHFRTNTCHTVAEWRLQSEASQQAMNQKQRGPICGGGGNCSLGRDRPPGAPAPGMRGPGGGG